MRFIYLSTTSEDEFKTKDNTVNFFKKYLHGDGKFHITERKIDCTKFAVGEDVFFLRAEKEFGYYTYKIVAYSRAGSGIEETKENDVCTNPYYFIITSNALRIFVEGINIKYFQNFIDDQNNKIKQVDFTGSIDSNKFTGHQSWIYFEKDDANKIMKWFRKTILDENIQMLCNL